MDLGHLPHWRVCVGFHEEEMTNFQWYELGIVLSEIGLVLIGAGLMMAILAAGLYAYFRYAQEK